VLGKKITVPAFDKDGRWEMLVQEWQPKKVSDAGAREMSPWRAAAPEAVAHTTVEIP
jgi:hypothetical protein